MPRTCSSACMSTETKVTSCSGESATEVASFLCTGVFKCDGCGAVVAGLATGIILAIVLPILCCIICIVVIVVIVVRSSNSKTVIVQAAPQQYAAQPVMGQPVMGQPVVVASQPADPNVPTMTVS